MVSLEDIANNPNYDFLFEFDDEGTTKQFRKDLILLVVGGSHAYGLNTSDSDVDLRGVIIEPDNVVYGLHSFSTITDKKTDTVLYGLKKFCSLVSKCNPNILDLLYCSDSDVLYTTKAGELLRKNRNMFLSKKITYPILGTVNNNISRITKAIENEDVKKANKYIMHSVRLLACAITCHTYGYYMVKQTNTTLAKIRDDNNIALCGCWDKAIDTYEYALKGIHEKSVLPDEPNITDIENLMIKIYKGE